MEFAGKKFEYYWKIIQFPFYILAGYSIVSFIIANVDFNTYMSIFGGGLSYIIFGIIFLFIGWNAVKEHKTSVKEAAWAGALTGALGSLVGAILGAIMIYTVPQIIEISYQTAITQGAPITRETIETFAKIGTLVNIFIGPLINGLLGAGVAAISAAIAKKFK